MAKESKKTYRLKNFNADTFDELWSVKYTKGKIWLYGLLIFIVLFGFVYVIIAFTPLKKTIPGYPSDDIESRVMQNTQLIDSLENELDIKETWLNNLINIIDKASGEYDTTLTFEENVPVNYLPVDTAPKPDTTHQSVGPTNDTLP